MVIISSSFLLHSKKLRKIFNTGDDMKDLIKRLDNVANAIELKGFIKEAMELDIIANTIEAFDAGRSSQGMILREVFDSLRSNDLKKALGLLTTKKALFDNILNSYGEFSGANNTYPAKDFYNAYEEIISTINQQNINGALEAIRKAFGKLRELTPIIQDYSGVTKKTQEIKRNAPPPSEMTFSSPPQKGLLQRAFR